MSFQAYLDNIKAKTGMTLEAAAIPGNLALLEGQGLGGQAEEEKVV